MDRFDLDPKHLMPHEHQLIDDEISRAVFDLLLKEPFYAHVLAQGSAQAQGRAHISGPES